MKRSWSSGFNEIGQPIVDEDGRCRYFRTVAKAALVAEHWEDYRAPTWAELQVMTDADLSARVGRQRSLDR